MVHLRGTLQEKNKKKKEAISQIPSVLLFFIKMRKLQKIIQISKLFPYREDKFIGGGKT